MIRRLFQLSIVLLLVAPLSTLAQSTPHDPADSTATLLGSFRVAVTIPDIPTGPDDDDDSDIGIEDNVFVFRTSNGGIDVLLDLTGIAINGDGDGSGLDSTSANDLVDLLNRAAIARSLNLGYLPCQPSGIPVRLWNNSCVMRSGSGTSTSFDSCPGTDFCSTDYSAKCTNPGGPSAINCLSQSGMPCTTEN